MVRRLGGNVGTDMRRRRSPLFFALVLGCLVRERFFLSFYSPFVSTFELARRSSAVSTHLCHLQPPCFQVNHLLKQHWLVLQNEMIPPLVDAQLCRPVFNYLAKMMLDRAQ